MAERSDRYSLRPGSAYVYTHTMSAGANSLGTWEELGASSRRGKENPSPGGADNTPAIAQTYTASTSTVAEPRDSAARGQISNIAPSLMPSTFSDYHWDSYLGTNDGGRIPTTSASVTVTTGAVTVVATSEYTMAPTSNSGISGARPRVCSGIFRSPQAPSALPENFDSLIPQQAFATTRVPLCDLKLLKNINPALSSTPTVSESNSKRSLTDIHVASAKLRAVIGQARRRVLMGSSVAALRNARSDLQEETNALHSVLKSCVETGYLDSIEAGSLSSAADLEREN